MTAFKVESVLETHDGVLQMNIVVLLFRFNGRQEQDPDTTDDLPFTGNVWNSESVTEKLYVASRLNKILDSLTE